MVVLGMNGLGKYIGVCTALWTASVALTLHGDIIDSDDWERWGIFASIVALFVSGSLIAYVMLARLCRAIEQQRDDITTDVVLGVSRELEEVGLRRHLR